MIRVEAILLGLLALGVGCRSSADTREPVEGADAAREAADVAPDTGTSASAPDTAGQLVITEIMVAPPESHDEWFELKNLTDLSLDLDGCVLDSTGGGSSTSAHTVAGAAVVAPGATVLLNYTSSGTAELDCVDSLTTCAAPALYRFNQIGFSNSDVDNLTITCGGVLIDTVNFRWTPFDGDCDDLQAEAGASGGCALQLNPDLTDASANDDATVPGAWELPAPTATYVDAREVLTLGTPGQANQLWDRPEDPGGDSGGGDSGVDTGVPIELPADACTAGQAILSELMPSPKDSGYNDEWIEVKGISPGGTCNLHACEISVLGPDGGVYSSTQINDPDGDLQAADGDYLVLARGASDEIAAGITWVNIVTGATVSADYMWSYNALKMPDCDDYGGESVCEWTVRLSCGDQVVDEAPMAWDNYKEQATSTCPANGCSVNLGPSLETVAGNDNLSAWCLPQDEDQTWQYTHPASSDGEIQVTTLRATPGGPGSCPQYAWPAEGEVVFTEIMPSPAGTNEWFEVANLTAEPRDLGLCSLVRTRTDSETGEITSEVDYTLGADGDAINLAPGAVQVFAKSGCILKESADDTGGGDTADTGDTGGAAGCEWGELSYGSLSFTDGETETLTLLCPNAALEITAVDSFTYNTDTQGVRQGHSLSFDPGALDGSGLDGAALENDSTDAWCEAGFSQAFCEAGPEECNYGSPGTVEPCSTETAWPEGSVCRCSATRWQAAWAPALVGLIAFGRRRRGSAGREQGGERPGSRRAR